MEHDDKAIIELKEEIVTDDVENANTKTPKTPKRVTDSEIIANRKLNGKILASTKPSYNLQRGIGHKFYSLKHEHRGILRKLLRQLMRQHNWEEAAGVLSMLLKGTIKDKSAARSRIKYWATMELLQHMKDAGNPRKIQNVYEIWMKKIGSEKGRSVKDRVIIQLEFILNCLAQGDTEGAYHIVLSLMQERDFGSNPISNLVVGLVFCKLWYTAIQKELRLTDSEERLTPVESEATGSIRNMSIDNSCASVQIQESTSPKRDSNTSIRVDKILSQEEVVERQVAPMEVDGCPQREHPQRDNCSQKLMNSISAATDGSAESILSSHSSLMPFGSILHARDLEPWLLPLRLPRTDRVGDFLYMQGKVYNDQYRSAIKHLQKALHSTPPAYEALLPLIQMLLLGDQVKEAVDEVERFVQISDAAIPLRIKASLLENFCSDDFAKLWTCFEETLKKDPTCNHSLGKLISMHHNGYYSADKLLEMISLNLDTTYGDFNTWQEFASCFLKICRCEEDIMSTCMDDNTHGRQQSYLNQFSTIPAMFKEGVSSKNWRVRCKWWLTRHFRLRTLSSEIDAGSLELVTYKAASASLLYGPKFEYVVKVCDWLEKEEYKDKLSILKMHMQKSVGVYNFPPTKSH